MKLFCMQVFQLLPYFWLSKRKFISFSLYNLINLKAHKERSFIEGVSQNLFVKYENPNLLVLLKLFQFLLEFRFHFFIFFRKIKLLGFNS